MTDQLIELGLNTSQAQCRLYVWQHGSCAASTVASHLSIERTNCYKILCWLEMIWLVSRTRKHGTTHFYIPDKSVLDTLIIKQEQTLHYQKSQLWTIKSQLDTLINPSTHDTPPIQLRSGRSGLQQWLINIIEQTRKLWLGQIIFFWSNTIDSIATTIHPFGEQASQFIKLLEQYHIQVEHYTGNGVLLLQHIAKTRDIWQLGYLPTGQHAIQVAITGEHLYIILYRREPSIVKISSAELTELMRLLFELSVK
jgi:hypothetical protein